MIIDGVFSGGGMKAIALVGALQVVEEKGFRFQRVAGTSAGALVAALVASGYKSKEITGILQNTEFGKLVDGRKGIIAFPFMKWIRLYWKLGLYRGNELERWVGHLLAEKGVETFADLPEGSLKVVASDLSRGRILVLPDDLKDYGILPDKFSVARAVRMSSGLPFFYEPVLLYDRTGEKSVIVDGGVLSNFPLWVFDNQDPFELKRPILGFQLRTNLQNEPAKKIHNAVYLYQSLFNTMRLAHDNHYITQQQASNIVFIPVDNVSTTHFTIDDETKQQLIELGRQRTENFLKKWTF
ncbi:MAG TPA: patatin-like phospholipase family protein [Bacillales bacterium]|nr:patatin-like phospholipase family protein [Bacillales bacterium]